MVLTNWAENWMKSENTNLRIILAKLMVKGIFKMNVKFILQFGMSTNKTKPIL